jgi:hypothetical protein
MPEYDDHRRKTLVSCHLQFLRPRSTRPLVTLALFCIFILVASQPLAPICLLELPLVSKS